MLLQANFPVTYHWGSSDFDSEIVRIGQKEVGEGVSGGENFAFDLNNEILKSQNHEHSDAHFGFWMNRHFLAIVAKKHFCTKKAVFRNRTN